MNQFISIIFQIQLLFKWLVYILIGLAVVYFLYGLLKYVISASESDKKEARGVIVNGIIILFVMVSVWGLVEVIDRTFHLRERSFGIQPIDVNSLIK